MEKTAEQVYNERWKSQVENEDGTINMQMLQDILKDVTYLEKNTSSVFEEFAPISDPYTAASDVISAIREGHIDKETALIDLATEIEGNKIAMDYDDLAQYLGVDMATKLEVKQQLEQRGQVLTDPLANIEMDRGEKTELLGDLLIDFLDELRQRSGGKLLVGLDTSYMDAKITLDVGE